MRLTRHRFAVLVTGYVMMALIGQAGANSLQAQGSVSGEWLWVFEGRGGNSMEITMKFEQDGSTVTGTVAGARRGGEPIEIEEGSFTDGILTFQVTRTFGEREVVQKFEAELSTDGDVLEGTLEITFGDRSMEREFRAERQEG